DVVDELLQRSPRILLDARRDRGQCTARRRRERRRVETRLHDEVFRVMVRVLAQRIVELSGHRMLERGMSYVLDHTHHDPATIAVADRLAYGVSIGPQSMRQRFIDDDDAWRFGRVGLVEVSPRAHRNPQRSEVVVADDTNECLRRLTAWIDLSF